MVGERIVLRAELECKQRRIVAHTTELSPRSVFVRTDESLALGDVVHLRLSFPRLLPPVELEAEVLAIEPDAGHGYLGGLRLGFASQPQLAELLDPHEAAAIDGTYRILVVEDSAVIRDCLQLNADRFAAQRSLRVQIDSVDTAEHALELFDKHPYELALVDFYLPGSMTGSDLVRVLRTRQADLPVIGFSIGGAAAREALLAAGSDLFLDKPVVVKDVFSTLDRLLRIRGNRMKRILLMDDSEVFLAVISSALRDAGYEVVCANDLSQLEKIEKRASDLVLMDVQMPEAFGDDIALVLRNTYGVSAPIYLLSSLDDADLADRTQWAQIEGFISKNQGLDVIVSRVQQILHGNA